MTLLYFQHREGMLIFSGLHVDYDGTAFNNMNSQMSGDELVSVNVTYVSQ